MKNSFLSIDNLLAASGFSKKSVVFLCLFLCAVGFSIGNLISTYKDDIYERYAAKPKVENYLVDVENILSVDMPEKIIGEPAFLERAKMTIDEQRKNVELEKTLTVENASVKIDDELPVVVEKNDLQAALTLASAPPKIETEKPSTDLKIYKPREKLEPLWMRNALDFVPKNGVPMIAIIIDDMGLDVIRSNRVLDIDAPITASYMAYAVNLQNQILRAKQAGKEVMMHIPMEAKNRTHDEGPDVLKDNYSAEVLREIMRKQIKKSDAIIGVNNHMGSKFTDDFASMNAVLDVVKDAGLLFVDSKTSAKSVAVKVADALKLPNVARDIFLDNHPSEKEVEQQLEMLERFAKRKGYAVAIGHPRDDTINVLKRWVGDVERRGFQIVPISAIIKKNM
ncbi:MAG: divergent polysaccharide deacetylase family protein [Rickettsiales bacterium]|jgi:polysaccharide deacetylase 2 family uncharacterized protein YibQ|nr:divergent polysaccharide deacetylase family protein [Rickettsiales bacterium]